MPPEPPGAPPHVSVVIPCYRQAHFLPDAISSVLAQTRPAHEIVVVDDGSPDDVAGTLATFPTVRRVEQENQGLSAARNAGLGACTGDVVVFLDADDRLLPTALATGCAALAAHPTAAFVWGFNRPIGEGGEPLGVISNPWQAGAASYVDLLGRNVVGPPVGVVFRREAVEGVGGFRAGRGKAEDYDLYLRLAREHDVHCHGEVVAEYRHHDAKMSSDDRSMLEGVLGALDAQEEHVRGRAELRRALRRGRRWAWRLYVGHGRIESIGKDVRSGRWARAGVTALEVLLRDPALLAEAARRRIRRRPRGAADS